MADAQLVDAADMRVGDDLLFLGTPRRITKITPYVGTLFPGGEARVAHSPGDWSVTLVRGQKWWVHRG